ncbi:MAG: TIGR02757 family protein [bacterium]|nr:TIGR02757 family protein [bacterium]
MSPTITDISFLKDYLEEKYFIYNSKQFIEKDPISIPHLFSKKEDLEISGFLTATISWGNRASIIKNARQLMNYMDHAPYEFIMEHTQKELKPVEKFVHRTFNGMDCKFFMHSLRTIYKTHGGLEKAFQVPVSLNDSSVKNNIIHFRKLFLEPKHLARVEKHISDPGNNSSAKRICMFLRWMVRKDKSGVDFGIWKSITPSQLCLPLDIHTGTVGRALGLLSRKQNDWKAVEEITNVLRGFDERDPVKYDYALFGLGVEKAFEKF